MPPQTFVERLKQLVRQANEDRISGIEEAKRKAEEETERSSIAELDHKAENETRLKAEHVRRQKVIEQLLESKESMKKEMDAMAFSFRAGEKFEVGAGSELGYVEEENQDRMSGSEIPLGQLYSVADGGGNKIGGALAAEYAVKGLQRLISEGSSDAATDEIIFKSFQKVNELIYQKAHSGNPATENMVSAVVLLLISPKNIAKIAHVGDCRAYLFRKGKLKKLTSDHTKLQKMVGSGTPKPGEAAKHPNGKTVERSLGKKPWVEVDISAALKLKNGDGILLCSGGLWHLLDDTEIGKILRSEASVQKITNSLIESTLKKGGEYNVTVQYIRFQPKPNGKRPMSIKCPNGHMVDPNWTTCPYCDAERGAKREND
jgi:protein phosphatase